MIAIPREDGGIEIHGSLQCPYYVHTALVRSMDLPADKVVVIQEETGGAFGGKEDYPSMIATHAALLARKAGRPVRIVYDRHEDLAATTKRHPSVTRHRTGVMRDGTLVAQDIEFVLDAGAYTTVSPVVVSRGGIHATGPYRCPNVRVRARAAMTNTPPNGAFRGFGAPQAEFAAETHLDRIAEALGMSPLEIRRRNAYREGDVTATGQVLRESVAALDVLEAAASTAEFERVARAPRRGGGCRRARRAVGLGHRDRPGLARGRLHWFRRGVPREHRDRGADRRGRDPGPDRHDGDGAGRAHGAGAGGGRGAGRALRCRGGGQGRHVARAQHGTHSRLADDDDRRRTARDRGRTPARGRGSGHGAPLRGVVPRVRGRPWRFDGHGAVPRLPGHHLGRCHLPWRCLPGLQLGVRRGRGGRGPRHRRGPGPLAWCRPWTRGGS